MAFIGNLLWLVFGGGLFLGLAWLIFGLIWCVTIVGIPVGIGCFRVAGFAFFPFGKELVPAEWVGEKRIVGTGIVNFLWCILSGLWLAIGHTLVGIAASAFYGKTSITKVVYPDTLRTIGGEAFKGCSSISLVLPALVPDYITSFNTSGRGVYEGCTSITQDFSIGFSPITTGGGQWIRDTKVTRADFGPYIATIPSFCFEATALKDLRLSEGLVTFNGGGEFNAVTNVSPAFPLTLKTLNMSFRSSSLVLPEVRLDNVTTLGGNFSSSTVRKIWFGPGIKSEGAKDLESFSADNITDLRVRYSMSKYLKDLRINADFEKVASRKAQAAIVAAEAQGSTTADWTPEQQEEGGGE